VAALSGLRLEPEELPLRPGFGTSGTPIKLRTNFFPVKVPKGPLHEYDVQIEPGVSIKRVKRRIFQLAELTPDWTSKGLKGNVAHDHSAKIIAAKPLPQPLVIKVTFTEDEEDSEIPSRSAQSTKGGKKGGPKKPKQPKEYTLTIKFVQELETQSLTRYVDFLTFTCPRGNAKYLKFGTFAITAVRMCSGFRRLHLLVPLFVRHSTVPAMFSARRPEFLSVLIMVMKLPRGTATIPWLRHHAHCLRFKPHSRGPS
jgi:hypothetical protein